MKLEASIVKKMKGFTLDVSLSVVQGEIVGLLGESGGGKSMTLKSIAGIITPDSIPSRTSIYRYGSGMPAICFSRMRSFRI